MRALVTTLLAVAGAVLGAGIAGILLLGIFYDATASPWLVPLGTIAGMWLGLAVGVWVGVRVTRRPRRPPNAITGG